MHKSHFILILSVILPLSLLAVPAYKGELTFKQKDGNTFKGKLHGDEWFHWISDKNGNIIVYNRQSKRYEYGKVQEIDGALDLIPSGVKVYQTPPSAIQGVMPQKVSKDILLRIWKTKRDKALSHHK